MAFVPWFLVYSFNYEMLIKNKAKHSNEVKVVVSGVATNKNIRRIQRNFCRIPCT